MFSFVTWQGLSRVVEHLLNPKLGHPLVVWFNLREDLVVECNGATYSWREAAHLAEPLIMPEIRAQDIEVSDTNK